MTHPKIINDNKRNLFFGLLCACPLSKPFSQCPMKETMCLPVTEKLKMARELPDTEIDEFIQKHIDCQELHQRQTHKLAS